MVQNLLPLWLWQSGGLRVDLDSLRGFLSVVSCREVVRYFGVDRLPDFRGTGAIGVSNLLLELKFARAPAADGASGRAYVAAQLVRGVLFDRSQHQYG